MAKTTYPDVDAYIAAAPPERQPTLHRLRKLIRKTVPKVKESIQHGMPVYQLDGLFLAFAAQKNYFSFHLNESVLAAHSEELGKLNCGKGCIRFRKDADLPDAIIVSLVKLAATSRPA